MDQGTDSNRVPIGSSAATWFQAIAFAPMWAVYNWNVAPWFKATSRALANRSNAIGIMAGLICLQLADLWLNLQNRSVLPPLDSALRIVIAFFIVVIFLHFYFTDDRFDRILISIKNLGSAKRHIAMATGIAIHFSLILFFLLRGPS
ncbi:hypothetical protein [Sphingosinicella sp.]|uniref:hypothetical protein n=1 Tax=Sphingosinicella sp. TaxID=1917971 RepID=UPI0040380254